MGTLNWGEIGVATALATTAVSLLMYLFEPRCKQWVWAILALDPARYDKLRIESLERNVVHTASVAKSALAEEIRDIAEALTSARAHADTLTFITEAIRRQGEELRQLPRVVIALDATTTAFKEMTVTLSKIHTEVIDHGARFERWEGFMEGQSGEWTGSRRRHSKRRATDPTPDDA